MSLTRSESVRELRLSLNSTQPARVRPLSRQVRSLIAASELGTKLLVLLAVTIRGCSFTTWRIVGLAWLPLHHIPLGQVRHSDEYDILLTDKCSVEARKIPKALEQQFGNCVRAHLGATSTNFSPFAGVP